MYLHSLLRRFCGPQNCPLPAVSVPNLKKKTLFFENTRLDPEILMALGGLLHMWNHRYSLRLFLMFLIISTIIRPEIPLSQSGSTIGHPNNHCLLLEAHLALRNYKIQINVGGIILLRFGFYFDHIYYIQ
jgi:hypothetical protein